jgi:hypothetical protein
MYQHNVIMKWRGRRHRPAVISVHTKKKELVGALRNRGR